MEEEGEAEDEGARTLHDKVRETSTYIFFVVKTSKIFFLCF